MPKTALEILRGSVRPVTLLGAVGVTLGLYVAGETDSAKEVGAFASPFIAWWFAGRAVK